MGGPMLADYDWVLVNTSSGKDSQTTLRFIVERARSEGFPLERF